MNTSLHLFDLRILQLLNLVWYLPKFWSEMSLQFQRIWCQHRPYLSSGNSSKTSNVFSDILRLSPFERWDIWILGLVEDWPLWSEMSPQFWRISISLTLQRHLMFSLTYYDSPLLKGGLKFIDLSVTTISSHVEKNISIIAKNIIHKKGVNLFDTQWHCVMSCH